MRPINGRHNRKCRLNPAAQVSTGEQINHSQRATTALAMATVSVRPR
jgi:hypothetical protein